MVRLLHVPPPLATRGSTRRRRQHPETKGFDLLSSSLPLPADCEECCHLQSQESTTNNQINFLSFLDLLPLVFFLPIWIYFTADRLLYKRMMALSSGYLWSDYRGGGTWLVVGSFCWVIFIWATADGQICEVSKIG